MNRTETDQQDVSVDQRLDHDVISFRVQFDQRSPLDEIVHKGARRMLLSAIDAERGRRLVVNNRKSPGT